MTNVPEPDKELPRNAASWAKRILTLQVAREPTGALNLNVEGRRVVGPLQGFGQMWQKTYLVRLSGVTQTPTEVMQIWKANFAQFQPPMNRFYPVLGDLEPGQVVLINASMGGMPVSTGVMVLYADDESFTLITPQGHPESGWVTFSVASEDECVVCQIQSIARSNDPLYEIGFRLFGSGTQEGIWMHVLKELATYFEINGQIKTFKTCVDPRVQWSEFKNIWQNAALRTAIYTVSTPWRWLRRTKKNVPDKDQQVSPDKVSEE
jgi:Domain of unknown function (DUF1990)